MVSTHERAHRRRLRRSARSKDATALLQRGALRKQARAIHTGLWRRGSSREAGRASLGFRLGLGCVVA